MAIDLPEINDTLTSVKLVVAVHDTRQGMHAWATSITAGAAKKACHSLTAGVMKDKSVYDSVKYLSTQLSTPLHRFESLKRAELTTLYGFFLYGGSFDLSTYSLHGHFCETVFGELHEVSLDWLEAGTGKPFSLLFCW